MLDIIYKRRSVREYQPNCVIAKEVYLELIKAGVMAPSARNGQPWSFICVDDSEIIKELAEKVPMVNRFRDASGFILVLLDLTKNQCGFVSYGEQYYKNHLNQTMVMLVVELSYLIMKKSVFISVVFMLDGHFSLIYIAKTLILFKEMQYGKNYCGKNF